VKFQGKIAVITGGDSGIGRAVCNLFSLEGATVAFTYVKGDEDKDAKDTLEMIKNAKTAYAKDPMALAADLGFDENCKRVVDDVVNAYGHIDILVNNAAEQYECSSVEEIDEPRLERVFRTNIFSYFFMTRLICIFLVYDMIYSIKESLLIFVYDLQELEIGVVYNSCIYFRFVILYAFIRHALKHMKEGSSIINTTSVNAYKGNAKLLDYTSTKGAIVAFTRGLSLQLVSKGIRVNGVAPGPIWTPLIPASFKEEETAQFGGQVPMNRAGQPIEVAPSYVFLASNQCSSYFTGQVLHPNGT
jgi:NAD(P)-dependent dehydrogenase (short-subunit alcohol dehydrogenase family)